jgi:hypothetical protein
MSSRACDAASLQESVRETGIAKPATARMLLRAFAEGDVLARRATELQSSGHETPTVQELSGQTM